MAESLTLAQVAAQQILDERRKKQAVNLGGGETPQEVGLNTLENLQLIGQPVTTESVIAAQHANTQAPQRNENRGYRAPRQDEIVRSTIDRKIPTGLSGRLH